MARLAQLAAPGARWFGPPKPGTPPEDIGRWLADNGLDDGTGISSAAWAEQPPAKAYEGWRFNRDARVWEPESLARCAEPG